MEISPAPNEACKHSYWQQSVSVPEVIPGHSHVLQSGCAHSTEREGGWGRGMGRMVDELLL
jgi:hypothetical protein